MSEPTPVHVDPSIVEAGLVRFNAILGVLNGLPGCVGDDAERQTQATLEMLDPRWTAERWAEVRHRLGLGAAGLKPGIAELVAALGPILLTDESRERAKTRLAEAERRRSPEGRAAVAKALGLKEWPPVITEQQRAEADAKLAEARAQAERFYGPGPGPLDGPIEIDGETLHKLTTLAILSRASLSETIVDLIDDAYELHEWSKRRDMRRARERSERYGS
jgi:hypothetical protein